VEYHLYTYQIKANTQVIAIGAAKGGDVVLQAANATIKTRPFNPELLAILL
jgi:hypothetical protein